MKKYRIYALILGEVLPEGVFFNCQIKKMSPKEQQMRKFAPIQATFSKESRHYKTYVQCLNYFDPIKIKSRYVVVYDVEALNENSALGGAARSIDKLARYLSIANIEDENKKRGKDLGYITPYIYQINKIYLLDDGGKEVTLDYKLLSGFTYLPDRPELNNWRDKSTKDFLEELYNFHDEILERAIKYLYRSSIGHFLLDSNEKIALDHFKSIEIIIDSLSNKEKFREKLKEAGDKIGLSQDEKARINKLWEDRSKYGDVAHPSKFDEAERYPNQFPLPSNVRYSGSFLDPVAERVVFKYFKYKKRLYFIDIEEPFDEEHNNVISQVNPWWESNHLSFSTSENDKTKIKQIFKRELAKELNVSEKSIDVKFGKNRHELIAKINFRQSI